MLGPHHSEFIRMLQKEAHQLLLQRLLHVLQREQSTVGARWAQAGQERGMTSLAGRERCITCCACVACTAVQALRAGIVPAQCWHQVSTTAARLQRMFCSRVVSLSLPCT